MSISSLKLWFMTKLGLLQEVQYSDEPVKQPETREGKLRGPAKL